MAGQNTIAIRMLRPFVTSDISPLQYIDNVKIGGTATIAPVSDPAAIPTPALLPGLIGMGVAALRKKGKKEELVGQEA